MVIGTHFNAEPAGVRVFLELLWMTIHHRLLDGYPLLQPQKLGRARIERVEFVRADQLGRALIGNTSDWTFTLRESTVIIYNMIRIETMY